MISSRSTLLAVAAIFFLPYASFATFADPAALIKFVPDDAFYYLKTASNLVHLGHATFDGVEETNGFHPLYFLVATALAAVSGKVFFAATFAFHGLCASVAAFLIARSARTAPAWLGALLVAAVSTPPLLFCLWFSVGMEACLVVPALAFLHLAYEELAASGFRGAGRAAGVGAALALLMLARLDLIIVAAPVAAVLCLRLLSALRRPSAPGQAAHLALALAIPLCACGAYLAWNVSTTGHVVPISAAVKHAYSVPFDTSWRASTAGGSAVLVFLLLLPLLLSLFVLGRALSERALGRTQTLRGGTVLLGLGVAGYFGYLRFGANDFFAWYFAAPCAYGAIVLAELLEQQSGLLQRLVPGPRMRLGLATAGVTLGLAGNAGFLWAVGARFPSVSSQLLQATARMDAALGEDAVVGTFDAGTLGFFSTRRVVNLDGLANSYRYLDDTLGPRRFVEYFTARGITHFLVRDSLLVNAAEVRSGRYERAVFGADPRVALRREDEVFRYELAGNFLLICYRLQQGR